MNTGAKAAIVIVSLIVIIAIIGYVVNEKMTCDAWAKELNGTRGSSSEVTISALLYNQKCAGISGMMRTHYVPY